MNKQVASRWKPGQSGNPAGRPVGARQKLEEPFIEAMRKAWETRGEAALTLMLAQDPGGFVRVMASLMPKDVAVSVQQQAPFGMDAEGWEIGRRLVQLVRDNAPEGASVDEIATAIEHGLRSHFALQIEQTDTNSARSLDKSMT